MSGGKNLADTSSKLTKLGCNWPALLSDLLTSAEDTKARLWITLC